MTRTAIVIGTGFGGAVAACRLAQAGIAVTVLERGRRYDGEIPYPRKILDMLWQTPKRGPYDIRAAPEMQVALAAGYGGGSLLYANVHLRLPADVFEAQGWPAGYTREALDPYYDLVAYMLDIKPITADPGGPPVKAQRVRAAAEALHRQDQFFHPPLAVDFSGIAEPHPNKFGVLQSTCTHCGECVIGCTTRAKNTLDRNYLAVAEKSGATMLTEREVFRIEPRPGGVPGYRVGHRAAGGGGERFDEADLVFVCAGAVGSTELLLRSRAAGALPDIGAELGQRYSGNGDLLAFAFQTKEPWQPSAGPTITTALLYDDRKAHDRSWFLLEEGGFPQELWDLVKLAQTAEWDRQASLPRLPPLPPPPSRGHLLPPPPPLPPPVAALVADTPVAFFSPADGAPVGGAPANGAPAPAAYQTPTFPSEIAGVFQEAAERSSPPTPERTRSFEEVAGPVDFASAARPSGALPAGMSSSAIFLAMGRDLADGRIELEGERLALRWDVPKNLQLYNLQERLLRDVAAQLGSTFAEDPFWRYARLPISVHNLGGCRMGSSDADGVTDAFGEVFHYPGLFVLDGAILPGATGVNPSHTIAAVAERNIEHVIRRETGDAAWAPPERKDVTPFDDPLTHIVVPPHGTPPPVTPAVGVGFDERMTGTWTPAPGAAPALADCRLRITVPDVAVFMAEPDHMGIVEGTIELAGLTDGPVPVDGGVWNLFVAAGSGPDREMRYALPFRDRNGKLYGLYGTKLFVPHAGLALWDESTTLEFHVYEGADRRGQSVGNGTITIGLFGVIKLAGSIEAIGADGLVETLRAKTELVGFFLETLAKLALG